MKPSLAKTLDKLREKGRKGVTFDDFPRGKEYRKRMSELRDMGFQIMTNLETLSTGCRRARYFLIKEPKLYLTQKAN